MFEANDSEGIIIGTFLAGRARAIYRPLIETHRHWVNGSRARAPRGDQLAGPLGGQTGRRQEGGQGPAPLARTGPARARETARVDQVPLRPKQRANLRGPLCMGARVDARTTPYKTGPRQPGPDPGTFARTMSARSRSVVLCGRREPRHLWWRASSAPATSSLPGRPPLCDWWRTGSLSWASLQERGSRPSQPWFLLSSGRRAASLVGSSRLSTVFGASSNGAPVTPRHATAPVPGSFRAVLKNAREPHIAGMTEARGRLVPGTDGIPGGAAPREPPFVGVSAGPDPHPRAWGNWMVVVAPPVRRGGRRGRATRVAPSGFTYIHSAPPGLVGPARSAPFARWPAARAPIRY
ncbi:uncharacterized protein P174DRAFT_426124 [Aspergillus novofumigatus IBT 16806]|uniref:Uncharacterized protein n=1 Tax=Aspergillus novofumigatus (strain IBT 16806) TaxID=1392255 RepID=A0A2I1BSA8_ASPN1|nr:uncharacterized protein P174DRAFT_426124 [Aspergillus novofumigatus IBT 16806]PKX88297.1 hypothetical protein P174DRAFT_426124 [Aspergillus novofumigatus IBT 16806]